MSEPAINAIRLHMRWLLQPAIGIGSRLAGEMVRWILGNVRPWNTTMKSLESYGVVMIGQNVG